MSAFRMDLSGTAASPALVIPSLEDGTTDGDASTNSSELRLGRLGTDGIVGNSPRFSEALQRARLLASLDTCVLLEGERGVGKQLIARAIHEESPRAEGLFVNLNCDGLPRDLLASELFGYADAGFNGARRSGSVGKIEAAHGGTLFLDEIAELPLDLQLRLLRVLEGAEVCPPGNGSPRKVQFRLISASSRQLRNEVAAGRFRMDLFLRVSLTSLELPALRERADDLPELVEHFSADLCRRHGLQTKQFSPEVLAAFARYGWPGNVGELRELVEQMVLGTDGEQVELTALPEELRSDGAHGENGAHGHAAAALVDGPVTSALHVGVEQLECDAIRLAIRQHQGNLTQAARALRIARSTLYLKMKKYTLELIRDEVRFATR